MGAQDDLRAFYARNALLGQSERYREATRAETYYWSLQYEHLEPWERGGDGVPLQKRKPKIIIPLFREAVTQLEAFVWGGHRFPSVVAQATDGDLDDDFGPAIGADDAIALTSLLARLVQHGRLDRAIQEATRSALVTTSCAIILGARGGHLTAHVETGKHCTPTFDPEHPGRILSLDILYKVQKEEDGGNGALVRRWYWYRRTITDTDDIVYREVREVRGMAPTWTPDPERSVKHDLGFCPVVWVRTMPDSTDEVDGRPVIDPALYPLLDEINYTVSLRNQAVQYGANPQPVRKGVTDEESRVMLRKSPGVVWDLPADGEFTFAEIDGSGAERAGEHLADLERCFRDACNIVKADPEMAIGHISGVVLEFLHAPLIALASELRTDFGDEAFCRLLNLALRLCVVLTQRGQDVWVPGIRAATRILQASQRAQVWLDVPLAIRWPSYFPPTVDDQAKVVQSAVQAQQAGLVSQRTATQHVAEVFGVENLDAEMEQISREQGEQADYGPMLGERRRRPDGKFSSGLRRRDDEAEEAPDDDVEE